MTKKLTCYLHAIEMCAPGMLNWQLAKESLVKQLPYQVTAESVPEADILPAREKRRASNTVHLSLYLAAKLQQQANIDASILRTVFASSDGDSDIFNYLAEELARPHPEISPTIFHQSLHNSAAGYWKIAVASQQSSLSISAGNATFVNGLLTAMIDANTAQMPVLLVAYNLASAPPMNKVNPIVTWFGAGLVLSTRSSPTALARIACQLVDRHTETALAAETWDILRLGNPIARSLPFFAAVAHQSRECIYLDYLDSHSLQIQVEEYFL